MVSLTGATIGRRCFPEVNASAIALARVLVARPSILFLLDEPFGALDALTRTDMHVLLEALWLRHGFTTLLITHYVAEAVALADRVVVIKNGRVGFSVDAQRLRVHTGAPIQHSWHCKREYSTKYKYCPPRID